MEKTLLIDTDGVIRDFVGGMEERCKRQFDFSTEKSIQALMAWTNEEFEAQLDCFQFWAELKPTEDAKQILEIAHKYFKKEKIFLISSSQQTPNAMCGCLAWYKKYTPVFYREKRIIFAHDKSLVSSPDKVLLDDHYKTCRAFGARGGWTVLMPRPWNMYSKVVDPLGKTELEIRMILHHYEEDPVNGQERVSSISP